MLDASHHPSLTRRTNRNRRVLAIVVNGLQRFHGSEGQDIRYPVIPSGDRYRLPVEESLGDTWDYKSKYDAANYLLSWLLTAEYLVIGTERYHQVRGQPLNEILNWFDSGMSNGVMESINSVIHGVKSLADLST